MKSRSRMMLLAGTALIVISFFLIIRADDNRPSLILLAAGNVLSLAGLWLETRSPRAGRSMKSLRQGLAAGFSIVLVATILIFLQALSSRYNVRLDTTSNKRYSLASQTLRILEGLETSVTFTCFLKEASPEQLELEDLLGEFSSKNPLIFYTFVDPERRPVVARRYRIQDYGTVVAECGEIEERFLEISEEKIANTILKITRRSKKTVCFVTGHGEKSITDTGNKGLATLRESLEEGNFSVRELFTAREERIPGNCDVLLIAGPLKDLIHEEAMAVSAYLAGGGNACFLIDPMTDPVRLIRIAAGYGIEVGNNVIIESNVSGVVNHLTPIVNQYSRHPITNEFRYASLFPQARALDLRPNLPGGTTVKIIAWSGKSTYAENDIETLLNGKSRFEEDHGDIKGPVAVAAVASMEISPAGKSDETVPAMSRIVVFGDSDFTSNSNINFFGNRDLIMNTISWLAEEEDLIALRPKERLSQPVILSVREGRIVSWLPLYILLGIVYTAGIIVTVRKRKTA